MFSWLCIYQALSLKAKRAKRVRMKGFVFALKEDDLRVAIGFSGKGKGKGTGSFFRARARARARA